MPFAYRAEIGASEAREGRFAGWRELPLWKKAFCVGCAGVVALTVFVFERGMLAGNLTASMNANVYLLLDPFPRRRGMPIGFEAPKGFNKEFPFVKRIVGVSGDARARHLVFALRRRQKEQELVADRAPGDLADDRQFARRGEARNIARRNSCIVDDNACCLGSRLARRNTDIVKRRRCYPCNCRYIVEQRYQTTWQYHSPFRDCALSTLA